MKRALEVALFCFSASACGENKSTDSDPDGMTPDQMGECIPLTESLDGDYTPGKDDAWPECISDSGKYTPIGDSISASARTLVIGEIGALLFDADKTPSPDAFLEARMLYDEDEGIGSRVARRYDPHYLVKGEVDCTVEADVAANPDYCVGPAKILPIVLLGFKNGFEGVAPRFHAGSIEGALLWFSAVSEYKETLSCSEGEIKDCDSAYGYYDAAGKAAGLGGYIKAVDPAAHDEATLGALAVRCWRDVDQDLPATNLTLREQARTQFDRAVIKGSISLLLSRIDAAVKAEGDAQQFHWGFVTTFLGAIESQTFRSAGSEAIIAEARVAPSPGDIDTTQLKAALQGIVECE